MPRHRVPHGVMLPGGGGDVAAPRAWGERNLQNLVRWSDSVGRGGHFPALEIPDLYAGDIRAFGREIAR
jgi:hypothetical protein